MITSILLAQMLFNTGVLLLTDPVINTGATLGRFLKNYRISYVNDGQNFLIVQYTSKNFEIPTYEDLTCHISVDGGKTFQYIKGIGEDMRTKNAIIWSNNFGKMLNVTLHPGQITNFIINQHDPSSYAIIISKLAYECKVCFYFGEKCEALSACFKHATWKTTESSENILFYISRHWGLSVWKSSKSVPSNYHIVEKKFESVINTDGHIIASYVDVVTGNKNLVVVNDDLTVNNFQFLAHINVSDFSVIGYYSGRIYVVAWNHIHPYHKVLLIGNCKNFKLQQVSELHSFSNIQHKTFLQQDPNMEEIMFNYAIITDKTIHGSPLSYKQTQISTNYGYTWKKVEFHVGKQLECPSYNVSCSLYLRRYGDNSKKFKESFENAIPWFKYSNGVIFIPSRHLTLKYLMLSYDFGQSWFGVLKGEFHIQFIMNGAVLVAISKDDQSTVFYSTNLGHTWIRYAGNFEDRATKIIFTFGNISSSFVSVIYMDNKFKYKSSLIDFSNVIDRICNKDDFEVVRLFKIHTDGTKSCFKGKILEVYRRKVNSICKDTRSEMNKIYYSKPQKHEKICQCNLYDYVCGHNSTMHNGQCKESIESIRERCSNQDSHLISTSQTYILPEENECSESVGHVGQYSQDSIIGKPFILCKNSDHSQYFVVQSKDHFELMLYDHKTQQKAHNLLKVKLDSLLNFSIKTYIINIEEMSIFIVENVSEKVFKARWDREGVIGTPQLFFENPLAEKILKLDVDHFASNLIIFYEKALIIHSTKNFYYKILNFQHKNILKNSIRFNKKDLNNSTISYVTEEANHTYTYHFLNIFGVEKFSKLSIENYPYDVSPSLSKFYVLKPMDFTVEYTCSFCVFETTTTTKALYVTNPPYTNIYVSSLGGSDVIFLYNGQTLSTVNHYHLFSSLKPHKIQFINVNMESQCNCKMLCLDANSEGTVCENHAGLTFNYEKNRIHSSVVNSNNMDSFCKKENAFICHNGQCVDVSKVCDGSWDCNDSTDELNCSYCRNEHRCSENRICLSLTQYCDGYPDCSQKSDEINCYNNKTSHNYNECGEKCGSLYDGDEQNNACSGFIENTMCKYKACSYGEFECKLTKQCIPLELRCDGNLDCDDDSDENECKTNQCASKCLVGGCLASNQRCNKISDCVHGEDEFACFNRIMSSSTSTILYTIISCVIFIVLIFCVVLVAADIYNYVKKCIQRLDEEYNEHIENTYVRRRPSFTRRVIQLNRESDPRYIEDTYRVFVPAYSP